MSKFMSSTDLKGGNRFEPWKPSELLYISTLDPVGRFPYMPMRSGVNIEQVERAAAIEANKIITDMLNSEI